MPQQTLKHYDIRQNSDKHKTDASKMQCCCTDLLSQRTSSYWELQGRAGRCAQCARVYASLFYHVHGFHEDRERSRRPKLCESGPAGCDKSARPISDFKATTVWLGVKI